MKSNRNFILVFILAIGVICVSMTVYAADSDITGTWIMSVQTQAVRIQK